MADIPLQRTKMNGVEPTFTVASSGGDRFRNPGDAILHVKNDNTSSVTLTIASPTLCNQGHNHDLEIDVPAESEKMIGPFDTGRFNEEGFVDVTYSSTTSLQVAAIGM